MLTDSGANLRGRGGARSSQSAPGQLPPHLSVLIGSLDGPRDLGRNHDKYLSFRARDENDSVASA
jgi:hypothetical protein